MRVKGLNLRCVGFLFFGYNQTCRAGKNLSQLKFESLK